MIKKKSRFSNPKFKYVVLVLSLVLIAGGAVALVHHKSTSTTSSPPSANNTSSNPTSNTPDSNQPANTAKDINSNSSVVPTPSGSSQAKVTPIITVAGQEGSEVTIRAYISDVFENDGTCTATFSMSGYNSVSKSSLGFENVSYTTCKPINISRSSFPAAGNWNLTVSYKSSKAQGVSASQPVKIE